MKPRLLSAAALALLVPTALSLPAAAQKAARGSEEVKIDRKRIDAALAEMVSGGRAAGVSALIWKDGREVYFGTAGYADREATRPMARDTLVQIFSMTKPVTGVALMQLWEQGKFGLDDPLARYLPEFATMMVQDGTAADGSPRWRPASRPILIRDVLRHTAGFGYGGGPSPAEQAFARAAPLDPANDLSEFGRRIAGVPLVYEPGTQWRYSAAVDVQALLVERLSGVPFERYVLDHVLGPLGMKETGWRQPAERLPRFAAQYLRGTGEPQLPRVPDGDNQLRNFGPPRLVEGGGGLVSSVDDYMRFARMLLNGGELEGARILKPGTVRLMATNQLDPRVTERHFLPGKGNMGFGFDFAVRVGRPLNAEEMRGALGEFFWDGAASTLFWVDPVNRMTVVFFAQTRPNDQTLHRDLRKAIYGEGYLGPAGD